MIAGMVEHDGHLALAIHLAKAGDNERTVFRTHGLSADTITGAIAELGMMALGCRTSKPLLHSWASPSRNYSEADWDKHRAAFEAEFGLVGFPCVEVFHLKYGKGGRTASHVHRVYLRVDIDGKAVRTSHSAVRQEKVSRIAEFMAGERFTAGCFNRAVITRLRQEGRPDVAEAMVRGGLAKAEVTAAPSSAERAMAERLHDLAADEVWRRAAAAWRRSDTGAAFKAALADSGLRLAMGEKCSVLVTPAGAIHPLLRAINKGGERQNGPTIRKAVLDVRLQGLTLPAAGDLAPVPGFDAGVFSISNLDRIPVQSTPELPVPVVQAEAASLPMDAVRILTKEQEAVLLELDNVLHSAAADRAQTIRQAIEAEVIEEVRRRKQHAALRLRVSAEQATWELPGIGIPGWRDRYRAELAGLPRKYGPYLQWVDRLDENRRQVTLTSGATVTLAPDRAWTATSGSNGVIPVMIAHAREQGWTSLTISGGPQWRAQMARAATRAGLAIADTDLQEMVGAERLRMEQEALVASWWRCRNTLAQATAEHRHSALLALFSTLEQITVADPDLTEHLTDDGQRSALAADLAHYDRYSIAQKTEMARENDFPLGPGMRPQ